MNPACSTTVTPVSPENGSLDIGSQDASSTAPVATSILALRSPTPPGLIEFSNHDSIQGFHRADETLPEPASSSPSESSPFLDCTPIDLSASFRTSSLGQIPPLSLGSASGDEFPDISTPQTPDYTLPNVTPSGSSGHMCPLCNRQFELRHLLK